MSLIILEFVFFQCQFADEVCDSVWTATSITTKGKVILRSDCCYGQQQSQLM